MPRQTHFERQRSTERNQDPDGEIEQAIKSMMAQGCSREQCKELTESSLKRSVAPGEDPAPHIYDANKLIDRIFDQERKQ